MERITTLVDVEIADLNRRAYEAWKSEYRHHLNWDVACVANLTTTSLRNGRRIIHLADDVLNQVAKLMNTHLHVFFGSREDKSKRPHLHLVIMTEKSLDPMEVNKLMLLIQGKWEKYGDSRRQDIDTPRGGNIMGYVINKNDGEDSHFVDRFYCPKTGPCSKRKRGKSRCIHKHRA